MSSGLSWSERANWGMLIGGIVMGACSVLFFATAVAVPQIRTSFLVTGVIFVASAALMIRLGWGGDDTADEEGEIRKSGVHAKATITSISPTGTTRHGRPEMKMQLRLEVPAKPPYLITKTDVVPADAVDQLTVGRTISVHSDPNDTLKIAIDWDNLNDVSSPPGWPTGWPTG